MGTTVGTTVHNVEVIQFEAMPVPDGGFTSYKVTMIDRSGAAVSMSGYVQHAQVAEFEKGWNDQPNEPVTDEQNAAVINALRVLMLDPDIQAVLKRLDPKAVEQAKKALRAIGRAA